MAVHYRKEMNEEEETRRERRAYRESLRRKRRELEETLGTMDAKTRLGRGKAPEEDLAVPDLEATGQLRKMPIKASAVRDRLSSILRRGLLPSRPETALEATKRRRRSLKAKHKRKMVSPLLRDNMDEDNDEDEDEDHDEDHDEHHDEDHHEDHDDVDDDGDGGDGDGDGDGYDAGRDDDDDEGDEDEDDDDK
eukprot:s2556_g7.t1